VISVRIENLSLIDRLQAAATINPDDVARVGGRAVRNLISDHLFKLDSRANKMGGKRTHFFANAAKSVTNPAVSGGKATVAIMQIGLAQRYFGGTIRAGAGTSSFSGGPTKYLAIPARAEAYGRAPSEFSDLHFQPTRRGGALVQNISKEKGGTVASLVMFWLVPSVEQAPDPSVLPTEEQIQDTATSAMGRYLARRLA